MKTKIIIITLAMLALASISGRAATIGTEFTYQGRLTVGTNAANGNYDLRFYLRDDATAGSPVGTTNTLAPTGVTNGLFTVTLDFGAGIFTGAARWLEIGVRTNGSVAAYSTLSPRQPLRATPYAIYAPNAGAAITAVSANGVAINAVGTSGLQNNAVDSSKIADGTITTSDLGPALLNNTFWKLQGNAGTTPGANFLGTTDNQPLEFKVFNERALRLEPRGLGLSPNVLGGYYENTAGNFRGAAIAGGGTSGAINSADGNYSFIGAGIGGHTADSAAVVGGAYNRALGQFSFVGTGLLNTNLGLFAGIVTGTNNFVGPTAEAAFIGAGLNNKALGAVSTIGGGAQNTSSGKWATVGGGLDNTSSGISATIGGGSGNMIQTDAESATIGGGNQNTIQPNAGYATIGGGDRNTNSGPSATVGGGVLNMIQTIAQQATIGGGSQNTIQFSANYATIGGGSQNTIQTLAQFATIPGGRENSATDYAFAAGRRAKANHTGAFVWADSTVADFASTADNQFLIRATGGVGINKTNPATALDVNGVVTASSSVTEAFEVRGAAAGYALQDRVITNASGRWVMFATGGTLGFYGAGNTRMSVTTNGAVTAFSFNPTSDRNVKQDFAEVNSRAVLEKVAQLPIQTWTFKNDPHTKHVGPMAQDFYAAFAVGPDDKHIATVDADGVALAAIQGLNQKVEEQRAENVELKQRLEKLERLMNRENGGAR